MELIVRAKHTVRLAHENNPCQATRDALRAARIKCQQTAGCCANDYWLKLSQMIQIIATQAVCTQESRELPDIPAPRVFP